MASSSPIAVSVRGLCKDYTIAHQGEKHVTLAESLLARARRPFARGKTETFHALSDVSFDIKKGDVVGIIGRNGAGKSTLLKILSRITEPTRGEIDLYGRVGSLLEVGTGFHPELTGRENIFLNGAILGMNKAEIRKQFDAIVEFAGVEKFLDTPVKRYSSGMYVRLAFAVAAHLKTEILLVDEVLAVGDAEFQKKCLGKMKDAAGEGRTVFIVSHSMSSLRTLCSSGLSLRNGHVCEHGDVTKVIERYLSDLTVIDAIRGRRVICDAGEQDMTLEFPESSTMAFKCGDKFKISFTLYSAQPLSRVTLGMKICDSTGTPVVSMSSKVQRVASSDDRSRAWRAHIDLGALPLNVGRYAIQVYVGAGGFDLAKFSDAIFLVVEENDVFGWGNKLPPVSAWGYMYWAPEWSIRPFNIQTGMSNGANS